MSRLMSDPLGTPYPAVVATPVRRRRLLDAQVGFVVTYGPAISLRSRFRWTGRTAQRSSGDPGQVAGA